VILLLGGSDVSVVISLEAPGACLSTRVWVFTSS